MNKSRETVLLTGASGFIGLHCTRLLLQSGFKVRGTIRNQKKKNLVRNLMAANDCDADNLELTQLDLISDFGWDAAMQGCDYVMHVASPFWIANPKNESDMLTPAVEGTLRVLRAANKAQVKRVVLTSSIVSMMSSIRRGLFTPDDWTDVNYPDLSTYIKSKTLAEQAAWDFVNKNKGSTKLELVVIAPGGVFGPPVGDDISGQSLAVLTKMLDGKVPMVPDAAFPMVDVRDVAQLHVSAIKNKKASGERFIASAAEPISFADAAQILLDEGYRGPSTKKAPRWLLRTLAIFDREARGMLALVDMYLTADNSKTRETFDWTPMPFRQSLIETAVSVQTIRNK